MAGTPLTTRKRWYRGVFDDIDEGQTGALSKDEMGKLFKRLNLELNEKQFEKVFTELDLHENEEISYSEFKHWWYSLNTEMVFLSRSEGRS